MKTFVTAALFCALSLGSFAQTVPSQAKGYKLVFSDDFTSLNLSPTGLGSYTWYPGIWFEGAIPLPPLMTSSNSILDLEWARSGGLSDTSIETIAHDGSEGKTFRYGYIEARMKWDFVNGAWPAFWMIPKQAISGTQHTGEIDIFEGQGNDSTGYYGTLHEWNGQKQLWTNSPKNRYTLARNNDFTQWHTYGILWVPGKVTWYYDNQPVGSSKTTAIFDQQDFFIVIGSQEGSNWDQGKLSGVSASSINLNVDWVHVWQNPTNLLN